MHIYRIKVSKQAFDLILKNASRKVCAGVQHQGKLCAVRAPTLFHMPVREVRHAAPVRRCGMTVMRMLFNIWLGLDYLSLELSHIKASSPNSVDLHTSQNSQAPVRAVRRAAQARGA